MADVLDRIADDIAQEHYARRQVLARQMSERAQDMWADIDDAYIEREWQNILPRLTAEVTVAQAQSAALSEPYVRAVTQVEGRPLIPAVLAGVASDGRSLRGLLWSPVPTAKTRIALGASPSAALGLAGRQLAMIVGTQVSDAGRVGDGVSIATRENVGYIRELRLPSCSRCIVLAGKWFEWNEGFARHPRCDCFHRPATREDAATPDRAKFDQDAYFASLSKRRQDQIFTKAGAQSIRDGADISQVVNASRGMTPAGTTLEGTTRRGFAGQRMAAELDVRFTREGAISRYTRVPARLMPEQIYRMYPNRGDAIEALRRYGYIV